MAFEAVVASASEEASEPLASTSVATPKVDNPRSAATPSRTPAAGSRRLVFSTPISTPSAPASSLRKNPRTPASGYKMGNEEMCAVCFSPLERDRDRRRDFFAEARETTDVATDAEGTTNAHATTATTADPKNDPDAFADPKRVLFTTDCNHVFHRCCLVKCREQDFSTCPMCRAALPSGLTPEHVREKHAARRLADRANAQQRSIVGAAQRAREAVRAQYVRAMVNRPRASEPGTFSRIEEEGEGGTHGNGGSPLGEMPPWMSPPRNGPRGRGGSAPATPARASSLPSSSPASRTDAPARTERSGPASFVTAAEELRALSSASDAVSLAFATASAPSTPARLRSLDAALGAVSSVVAGATRGPGNAGTLDGIAAAEEDRTLRASSRETGSSDPSESALSLAAALGAALGESFAIRDDEEDALSFAQTTDVVSAPSSRLHGADPGVRSRVPIGGGGAARGGGPVGGGAGRARRARHGVRAGDAHVTQAGCGGGVGCRRGGGGGGGRSRGGARAARHAQARRRVIGVFSRRFFERFREDVFRDDDDDADEYNTRTNFFLETSSYVCIVIASEV